METLPVCYVWPLNRETEDKAKPKKAVEKPTEVAKKPVKQTVEKKHQASIPPQVDDFTCGAKHQPPMDSMMKLSVYDNGETGTRVIPQAVPCSNLMLRVCARSLLHDFTAR